MFTHHYWGCGRPNWAYAGPVPGRKIRKQLRQQCYESRRSGHSMFGLLFGVRRPLRVMTSQLELDEDQVRQLAAILGKLKTERSQANVDWERSVAEIADAMEGETFDLTKAEEALRIRVNSAKSMREEVLDALKQTHAMLDDEQRAILSYLLRSGQLSI